MNKIPFSCDVSLYGSYDVCVVGGGMAGVAAAVSSARCGMKTLLVERTGCLGGMATTALVGPFMTSYDRDGDEPAVGGIYREIVQRLQKVSAAIPPEEADAPSIYTSFIEKYHRRVTPFDSFQLEITLDEMVREAGAEVLCYTNFASCIMENDKIKQVILLGLEGLIAVEANMFIDSTGIAAVCYQAGVPTYKGDEQTGIPQPATLFFEVANADDNAFSHTIEMPVKAYRTPTEGVYKVNSYHVYNVDAANSKSVTDAHSKARYQVFDAMEILNKRTVGFENATLIKVASEIGIRESRHVKGEYTITVDDVSSGVKYPDRIGVYGFGMDVHNRTPDVDGKLAEVAKRYYIPYRSLVTQNCSNLLVAGKCLSCHSDAVGGMRCIPAVIAMGQAAGNAAAIAINNKITPKQVPVDTLQKMLLEQNAIID